MEELTQEDKIKQIIEEVIATQSVADYNNDKVAAVYHKNPTKELADALANIEDYASNPDFMQESYKNSLERFKQLSPDSISQEAEDFDWHDKSEETRKTYLSQLKNVSLRPLSKENDQEFQILTKDQLFEYSRRNVITNILEAGGAKNLLGKYGGNMDYQPSIDVMEIAAMTAIFTTSLILKEMNNSQLVTPQGLEPGKLWSPGK